MENVKTVKLLQCRCTLARETSSPHDQHMLTLHPGAETLRKLKTLTGKTFGPLTETQHKVGEYTSCITQAEIWSRLKRSGHLTYYINQSPRIVIYKEATLAQVPSLKAISKGFYNF